MAGTLVERVAMELRQIEAEDAAHTSGNERYGLTARQTWERVGDDLRDGYRRDARRLVAVVRQADRRAGRMESTVRKLRQELEAAGKLDAVRASLVEGALLLARALDAYAETTGTAAQLSAIAKANQELRTSLARLTEGDDDRDDAAADAAEQSTPVWDPAAVRHPTQPGPADVGAAVRGGGTPAR